jgi:O-antigen ligase
MKRFVEAGLLAVLIVAVLAFGAVESLFYSLVVVGVCLLLVCVLVREVGAEAPHFRFPTAILPFLFLVLLQLIPLPASWVAKISPEKLAALHQVQSILPEQHWIPLSVDPHATLLALCKFLAYCGAFALAAYAFEVRRQRSLLLSGLLLLGCFEAGYGIVQYSTGYQKIFTYTRLFYTNVATGTYVNRNHFAGLLEMLIPLAVARVFYEVYTSGRRREAAAGRTEGRGGRVVFYAFLAIVMAVGCFMSGSRMGIFALLAALVFLGVLGQWRGKRRAWTFGMAIILGCSLVYGFWVGINPVLKRFELLGQEDYVESEGRLPLWRSEIRLIKDYPLAGTGLGTFKLAFRQYQDSEVNNLADHAHNDYLEFACETGLAGALLLWLPIYFLWGLLVISFLESQSSYRQAVLLGCAGSVTALLIHSITDFNLQIPANALLFATLLGIGYAATRRKEVLPEGHSI